MGDFFEHRRVLILGGLGFIGSNLALELVERNAQVTLADSLLAGHGANEFNIAPVLDRVDVRVGDIRDGGSLAAWVTGQDVIFSLAAQVSHVGSMHDPLLDLDINCRAQLSLLECCRRRNPTARLVFASTRQVYGRSQYLPVDERHPIAPPDANGVGKRAAELYYALYHRVYGLWSVCLRLTNTYGPRLGLRGAGRGFLSVFIERALRGAPIDVFGTGEQRRDFNYVDDVVDALLRAAECHEIAGQSLNLGHARNYSLLELVHTLQRHAAVEFRCVPFPAERMAIDVGDYYGDFTKFREATGWTPRVDLDEGIGRTMEFFRRHRTEYWGHEHDPDVRRVPGISERQGRD